MNKIIKEILNDFKKNKRIIIRTIIVLSLVLMAICIYDLILNYDNSVIDKYVSFLSKRDEEFVQIEKNVDNEFSFIYSLDDKDKKNIESKLKKLNYVGMNVYRIGRLHLDSSKIISYEQVYDLLKINSNYKDLYTPYTFNSNYLDIVELTNFDSFLEEELIGKIPQNNDEIIISNHFANLIMSIGIIPYGEENYYYPSSYEEIISSNKYYYFGNCNKIKIVGIINYDLSEYDQLKNISWGEYNEKYYHLGDDLSYRTQNIYNKIFVNKDFIVNLNLENNIEQDSDYKYVAVNNAVMIKLNNQIDMKKILNEFNDDFTVKSTYSEIIEEYKGIFNNDLVGVILLLIVSALIFGSIYLLCKLNLLNINKFQNKKQFNKYILINSSIINLISMILTLTILVILSNIFKNIFLKNEYFMLTPFCISIRQVLLLLLVDIIIIIIIYIITNIKIKKRW